MPYEKVIKHLVQPILGKYDDDGELIGERPYYAPGQMSAVYYPAGLNLENLTHQINRELAELEREALMKSGEVRR